VHAVEGADPGRAEHETRDGANAHLADEEADQFRPQAHLARRTSKRPTVRNTAIGSLDPLSISRVAATRAFRFRPLARKIEKTAAASVEPTMLPEANLEQRHVENCRGEQAGEQRRQDHAACRQHQSRRQCVAEGSKPGLQPAIERINTSATVPTPCASV